MSVVASSVNATRETTDSAATDGEKTGTVNLSNTASSTAETVSSCSSTSDSTHVPIEPGAWCERFEIRRAQCQGNENSVSVETCATAQESTAELEAECQQARLEEYGRWAQASCEDWDAAVVCRQAFEKVESTCQNVSWSSDERLTVSVLCNTFLDWKLTCDSLENEATQRSTSRSLEYCNDMLDDVAKVVQRAPPQPSATTDYFCPQELDVYLCLNSLNCEELRSKASCITEIDVVLTECFQGTVSEDCRQEAIDDAHTGMESPMQTADSFSYWEAYYEAYGGGDTSLLSPLELR